MRAARPHLPTVAGRLRSERGLLLLVAAVVGLTTALTAAVTPVTERTADRAVAQVVRDAGLRGTVVASLPGWFDRAAEPRLRPGTAAQVRRDAAAAEESLPAALDAVLRPGIATVTTTPLQLLDEGPGRYLQLAYLDGPSGPPAVTWTSGRPPRTVTGRGSAVVEVGVSDATARALDTEVGEDVDARDEQGRPVVVRVSGTFTAQDPGAVEWTVAPRVLQPSTGVSDGLPRTAGTALVSAGSLPDLRLALPDDALVHRLVLVPEPDALRWRRTAELEQTVESLRSGAGLALGGTTWDSLLGTVLQGARAEVSSAQAQAQVLLVSLLACAVLVLALAGQLLVRRRSAALSVARERGATVAGVAVELVVESVLVAALGGAVGLLAVRLLVGSVGWAWSLPVLLAAVAVPASLGAFAASRAAGGVREPANRSARRARDRAAHAQRLVLEGAVLVAAALSTVALLQRGTAAGGTDLAAAGAVTWLALAGASALLRALPPALRRAAATARGSRSVVPLVVVARLASASGRALPAVVVVLATVATTFGTAFASTLLHAESVAARGAVGADARLDAPPGTDLGALADRVGAAAGVRAVAVARVEDGVRVSATQTSAVVRLVVVDADDYGRLLRDADLPGSAGLARLGRGSDGRVPALVAGAPPGLSGSPRLGWEDTSVALTVVGTAPRLDESAGPVVVVDAAALAAAGVEAPPDTLWAVGPGAAAAVRAVAGPATRAGSVITYADELDRIRGAALPAAMLGLTLASGALVLVLALLGVALGAGVDAPGRRRAIGRLRAQGLPRRDLRQVLLGELGVPVAVAGVVGLAVGVACSRLLLGSLGIERLTGVATPASTTVPWWAGLPVVVLVGWAVRLALLDARRVRRTPLPDLLRE